MTVISDLSRKKVLAYMKMIDLKTLSAEIDSTGTVEKGRKLGIKYVNAKGEIREMVVSKRVKRAQKPIKAAKTRSKASPNMKNNALIPIIDHTDGEKAKDLFLFAIIGFNPDGKTDNFFPIKR